MDAERKTDKRIHETNHLRGTKNIYKNTKKLDKYYTGMYKDMPKKY